MGRLIAEQGHEVVLLPYTVSTVADFASMRELIYKRMRWIVVMRHMRPWGHLGLLLTHGLPWSLAAVAVQPTAHVALAYLGTYLALRCAMTWIIGVWGLKQPRGLEEAAADSAVGRGGVFHLGGQFHAPQRALARQRLLHSRRAAGAAGINPGLAGRCPPPPARLRPCGARPAFHATPVWPAPFPAQSCRPKRARRN